MNRILLFLLLSITIISCKKESNSLQGVITESGRPSPNAIVSLVSLDGKIFPLVTSIEGHYEIKDLEPGSYLLVVQSSETTVTPDQQLQAFINNQSLLQKYLKQTIDNKRIEQLKQERDRSIGVEAMTFASQVQTVTNEVVAQAARQAKIPWNEANNRMITLTEIQVKGSTMKDVNL